MSVARVVNSNSTRLIYLLGARKLGEAAGMTGMTGEIHTLVSKLRKKELLFSTIHGKIELFLNTKIKKINKINNTNKTSNLPSLRTALVFDTFRVEF